MPSLDELPPRQRQVLDLVVAGHTNKQIAAALAVSESTVRNHLIELRDRFGFAPGTFTRTRLAIAVLQGAGR